MKTNTTKTNTTKTTSSKTKALSPAVKAKLQDAVQKLTKSITKTTAKAKTAKAASSVSTDKDWAAAKAKKAAMKQKAIELHKQGLSLQVIAGRLGADVPTSTVWRWTHVARIAALRKEKATPVKAKSAKKAA